MTDEAAPMTVYVLGDLESDPVVLIDIFANKADATEELENLRNSYRENGFRLEIIPWDVVT
jgi:hypothetical protein